MVFPLIGPRQVLNESPASLKDQLISDHRVYLRNPSIDVTMLRRVNALGAVARPGLYPIDPTMTMADLAGGATPVGDPDKVRLIGDGQTLTTTLNQRTRIAELSIRPGYDVPWSTSGRWWESPNVGHARCSGRRARASATGA